MAGNLFGIVGLAVLIGVFPVTAHAVALSLTNPSFESNSAADGATSSSHSGWTKYAFSNGAAVTWNPTSASFSGADGSGSLPSPAAGSQCLWVTGEPDFYQSAGVTIAADKVYTLTVAVGSPLDEAHAFSYYGIELWDSSGTSIVKNWGNSTNSTNPNVATYSGLFYDESVSFSTASGSGNTGYIGNTLVVYLSGDSVALDNVRLTVTTVPEPGGAMLLSTGAIVGLLVCVWQVRKRAKWRLFSLSASDNDEV